ncbi:MAG TPA: SPOR domain-containing protein [Gemmatimonadota bacterium]|nr:SPOR domain-containing protein [Gemmatimonadota bacterium]
MRSGKLGAKAIACAAVLLVALVLGAIPAAGQDAAQLLDRGKRAFEAGDFEAARTDLWAYLEATAGLTGPSRLPQADALYTIALMEADAAIAAQHYRTIVEEYAASSVADEALFRLAQLDLVEGRTEEARGTLQRLSVDYPFSRYQAEIPLWTGKAWLADRQYRQATDAFIEGFTRVKRQDLPQELSAGQREALGAEYVYQLARAFGEEGDSRTATQYYAMLALDYPDSPQAAEARLAMEAGAPVQVAVAGQAEGGQEPPPVPSGEPVAPDGEPVTPTGEPVARADAPVEEAPEIVIEDAGPREDAPAGAAGGAPVYVPDAGAGQAPAEGAPDVIIEDARPREEPPSYEPAREEPVREDPPPVVIEDARPRDQPAGEPDTVWIQVGAFTSATNAAQLSSRLKDDGFFPEVAIGVVDGQGYYRVRIGPFALPSAAERLEETRRRLEAGGYPARQVDD